MTDSSQSTVDHHLLAHSNASPQRLGRLQYWWQCHIRALLAACRELLQWPLRHALTLLVIGVALSLPVSLFALWQNVNQVVSHWQAQPKVLLYLNKDTNATMLSQLQQTLAQNPVIKTTRYISPAAGLASLQQNQSIGSQTVSAVGTNPLPGVIEITPNTAEQNPRAMSLLTQQLQTLGHVQSAQLNLTWIKRLFYLSTALKILAFGIGGLFAIGLVLLIANTMRLELYSHQEEVAVLRLIGATSRYIRRPMLYRAMLYGIFGSILSIILCNILLYQLQSPLSQLALSYNTALNLNGLSFLQGLLLIVASAALSYLGARFTR